MNEIAQPQREENHTPSKSEHKTIKIHGQDLSLMIFYIILILAVPKISVKRKREPIYDPFYEKHAR
jgi:hypothetical protein